MKFLPTKIPGVILMEPAVHRDGRGFFLETYHALDFQKAGLDVRFVQDNHSGSVQKTLRGLHMQIKRPQGKLVRAVKGEILDVAVDVRIDSPHFKKWDSFILSAENFKQVYIPPGFAHGFYALSDYAEVEYKCTNLYEPSGELRIRWDDPDIGIKWPVREPLLSAKDSQAFWLKDVLDRLPKMSAS